MTERLLERLRRDRKRGVALVLMVVLGMGLLVLGTTSLGMTLVQRVAREVQQENFTATQIAESAAAQAIARIKLGGENAPISGVSLNPTWVNFSDGQYFYYTVYDAVMDVNVIRAWGRVASDPNRSSSTVAPDTTVWDGTGWTTRGVEVSLKGGTYIPESPLYFGNGGIEKPEGGFAWTVGADPNDPSTWGTVSAGSEASWQDSSVAFQASALDHPVDYNYNGGVPTPASGYPHNYQIWASQNPIGQFNTEAWFKYSAGATADPTTGLEPPPTTSYYEMADKTSPDHAYPVDSEIPDVQNFTHALWSKHKDAAHANQLAQGSHWGDYGDLNNPSVTFVTGKLTVPAGETLRGTGILVIRDDYDPNLGGSNTPSTRASLLVQGNLEWTGLVIVAGWAPSIEVATGGDTKILGAFFGEDSVQSGGETSLDSATIILKLRDRFRVNYSNGLFRAGGLINSYLPKISLEVVGIRDIPHGEINTDYVYATQ